MARTFHHVQLWFAQQLVKEAKGAQHYVWGTDQGWLPFTRSSENSAKFSWPKPTPKRMEDALGFTARCIGSKTLIEHVTVPILNQKLNESPVRVNERLYFAKMMVRAVFLYGQDKKLFDPGTVGHMVATMAEWIPQVSSRGREMQIASGNATFDAMLIVGPFTQTKALQEDFERLELFWHTQPLIRPDKKKKPPQMLRDQLGVLRTCLETYKVYARGLQNSDFEASVKAEETAKESVEEPEEVEAEATKRPNTQYFDTSSPASSPQNGLSVTIGALEESMKHVLVKHKALEEKLNAFRRSEPQMHEGRILEEVRLFHNRRFRYLSPSELLLPEELKAIIARLVEHTAEMQLTPELIAAIDHSSRL